MSASRRVQDILDLLDLPLRPVLIPRPAIFEDAVEDAEQAEGRDRFFVHHVQLVADSPDGDAGAGAQDGRLADQRAARKGVDDRLGALLGFFGWHVGGVASCEEGGQGCSGREGRSEFDGSWMVSVLPFPAE